MAMVMLPLHPGATRYIEAGILWMMPAEGSTEPQSLQKAGRPPDSLE